jgi:hypothetical protein
MEGTFSYDKRFKGYKVKHAGGSVFVSDGIRMPTIATLLEGKTFYSRERLLRVTTTITIKDGIFKVAICTGFTGNDVSFKLLLTESTKQSLIDAINSKSV